MAMTLEQAQGIATDFSGNKSEGVRASIKEHDIVRDGQVLQTYSVDLYMADPSTGTTAMLVLAYRAEYPGRAAALKQLKRELKGRQVRSRAAMRAERENS